MAKNVHGSNDQRITLHQAMHMKKDQRLPGLDGTAHLRSIEFQIRDHVDGIHDQTCDCACCCYSSKSLVKISRELKESEL